jgi:hypothetical protein
VEHGVAVGIWLEPGQRALHFIQKLLPKTLRAMLVPARGLLDIGLSGRPELDR